MLKLIRRLRISHKLTLVSASFLIPDFVLMCLFLVTINGYIDFARLELNGNEYLRPLQELLSVLPRHQQLARRYIGGDPPSAEELSHVQARVDAAIDRLITVDARLGASLQFTDEGLAQRHREQFRACVVAEDWKLLKKQLPNLDEATSDGDHRRLIADVRGMIGHAGDTSNLILDPDLDSYYLMDVTLLALPQMQDRLATVLLQGESCLRRGVVTSADRGQFKAYTAMLQEADLGRVLTSARTALNEDQNCYGPSESLQRMLPAALDKFADASRPFIALTARLADTEKPEVSSQEFLAAGAAALGASSELWNVTVGELDGLLRTRIDHYRHRRVLSLLLAGLAFTAAILLVTFITRSISAPLERQADQLRQAGENTQAGERRARAIIDAAPDCVVTMDAAGKVVEFNRAAEKLFGYSRAAAVGRAVADLIVPAHHRQAHVDGLNRYLRTGVGPALGRQLELTGLRSDGSEFPIEIAISAVAGQDAPTFIAFIRDITRRKQSADELKRLYAESQLLLSSISSVLIHLDSSGIVTRWNAAAESVFGLGAAEAIGRCCRSLPWRDADIPQRLEDLARYHVCERFPHVVVKRPDGEERVLDLTMNPICSDGNCTGLLVLGNDRTEHVQLEESLRQAQKLESIGQLAAGIAHEINTPMQFISDNIEYLSDCSKWLFKVVESYERNLNPAGPERSWHDRCQEVNETIQSSNFGQIRQQVPAAIGESKEGIERVIHIVRAMKEFSHPGGTEMQGTDLNEAIRSTATISRNRWKYVADLELVLDPDLPMVDCLPAEINQVLLNLIVNAGDAIGDKIATNVNERGRIKVRTRSEQDHVVIEVEDNGCGIPDEIRNRIFDPFFTTKEVGKGTGQGLAICYNVVVTLHHGELEVDSTPGMGTCFTITLPVTQQSPTDPCIEQPELIEATLASALID
jgi:PAS domain S-box-containing protein